MKKLKMFFIVILFVIVFQCGNVYAETSERFQIGDNVWSYIEVPDGYNEIPIIHIEGTGKTYDYMSDGYDKDAIHESLAMHFNLWSPTKPYILKISEGITHLGHGALYPIQIAKVTFPQNGLIYIGDGNFKTYTLTIVDIDNMPKKLEYLGVNNRFNVLCNNGFETLPAKTFKKNDPYCYVCKDTFSKEFTEIIINDSTARIASQALNYQMLQIITIPPSVTCIDDNAFWRNGLNLTIKGYTNSYAEKYAKINNIKFESIGIVESVPEVGQTYTIGNFKYKVTSNVAAQLISIVKKTAKVSIPSTIIIGNTKLNVTSIASKAFYKDKVITSLSIGKNVNSIGTYAFSGCSKLTKVTLPVNVKKIGSNAFRNSQSLKYIKISGTKLSSVGTYAFYANKTAKIYVPKDKYTIYKKLIDKSKINKGQKYVKF